MTIGGYATALGTASNVLSRLCPTGTDDKVSVEYLKQNTAGDADALDAAMRCVVPKGLKSAGLLRGGSHAIGT